MSNDTKIKFSPQAVIQENEIVTTSNQCQIDKIAIEVETEKEEEERKNCVLGGNLSLKGERGL